jgi:hypothetical protein
VSGLRHALVLAGLALLTPGTAQAYDTYLFGEVAKAPVFVMLDRIGGRATGWYLYLKQGKEIRIEGTADAGGHVALDEFDANTGAKTGHFDGRIAGVQWRGSWTGAKGKAAPFALTEMRGGLQSASVHCQTKTRLGDYDYRHRLVLTIAQGAVTKFETSRGETYAGSKEEEQSCQIGLSDLEPAKDGPGILLRAKGDKADDEGPHCTVRITGNGDWLYVEMGDASGKNNDCREAADAMFCSPRSFWTDMIVNRKTGVCRSVQ